MLDTSAGLERPDGSQTTGEPSKFSRGTLERDNQRINRLRCRFEDLLLEVKIDLIGITYRGVNLGGEALHRPPL